MPESVDRGPLPSLPPGIGGPWRRYAVPLLAAACFFVPLASSNAYYVHSVMSKVCIYTIVIAGIDLVVGYAGDVSVGHAGLFAAGAYTAAILMWKLHLPFPLAALAGIAMGALFGLLLGVPALRLTGPYLAVATIAFGLIVQTFINEAVGLTNGSQGIREIPALRYGPVNFEGNNFYYLVYPLMVLTLVAVHRLATSYWGRAVEALKENAVAAACCGISRYRFKLGAFILSAAFAGLAGALFVHVDKYIGPPTFSLQLSILFLIAVIFGGTRSILGNIIGTFLVVVLPDVFNAVAEYQLLIFGVLLLLTLYFIPHGIAGLLRALAWRLSDRFGGSRRAASRPRPGIELPADVGDGGGGTLPAADPVARRTVAAPAAAGEAGALLATRDLTVAFGGLVAVNKLNLRIDAGRVHALIGPNGSGKTTTVNLLSGIYRPTAGRIQFAGREIERAAPNEVSRLGIARTFQNVALFGDMTVLENVLVGLHHTYRGGLLHVFLATRHARREEARARARAQSLLDFVGIGTLAAERARSLPYGKQRLLEIARALAQDPALILLDEPAAGLTSGEIAEVDALIGTLRAHGIAILLIEHHMELVMGVSDDVTVLDFGKQIASGKPAVIQQDERVISAYLGTTVAQGAAAPPPAEIGQGPAGA
ncbi:MAG TPA: branched-chain amino acid ABC transporter ATP-binding protein/permease [Thermoanaerobaculia bacterium]|nr:branched-chain amino acid ABC transporter ATP-binding protein/permease [Thermoanaerobaculia bacterium]